MTQFSTIFIRRWLPTLLFASASLIAASVVVGSRGVLLLGLSVLLLAATSTGALALWQVWRATPPWRRFRLPKRQQSNLPLPTQLAMRRTLFALWVAQKLRPVPAVPRVGEAERSIRRNTGDRTQQREIAKLRFTLPSLHLHFVEDPVKARTNAVEICQYVAGIGQQALLSAVSDVPALLALHEHPQRLLLQFALSPTLSAGEQRAVVQTLQMHGLTARWEDSALLSVGRATWHGLTGARAMPSSAVCWLPVLRDRQATIWWPLAQEQSLVLAGAMEQPLTSLLYSIEQLHQAEKQPILIHDPDGRLRALNDRLSALRTQVDALAEARRLQLAHRFTAEREPMQTRTPLPLCIVVAPTETVWPDLQPLLASESGVQVVLVLSDRQPIAPLRPLCHQLPVIETPDTRYAPLPDSFRPAGVPAARLGQVIAWLPGGQTVWRGTRLGSSDLPQDSIALNVELHS